MARTTRSAPIIKFAVRTKLKKYTEKQQAETNEALSPTTIHVMSFEDDSFKYWHQILTIVEGMQPKM